jgi:hypothetical protein
MWLMRGSVQAYFWREMNELKKWRGDLMLGAEYFRVAINAR